MTYDENVNRLVKYHQRDFLGEHSDNNIVEFFWIFIFLMLLFVISPILKIK